MSVPEGRKRGAIERWGRIKEAFAECMARDRDARATFLSELDAADASLAAEVRELLAFHEKPGRSLESAALGDVDLAALASDALRPDAAPADDDVLPTDRIGRYRLLGVLGHGGMGVVYRAEQDNPRRTVALKVIRPLSLSPGAVRRFEYEAQLLARLTHPGIAQIYEAGTATTEGVARPYFAMELVDGARLTEHARDLDVRARLELFASVCDAVQHAHQKGVVHRDLKPGNVLVDGGGRPKVLDFGVARADDVADGPTRRLSTAQQIVGTLPYMSPEQITGEDVDTRTDVYSLGVVLYELLTGLLPLTLHDRSLTEAIRAVAEDEPRPLGAVDRTLRGDLETIVAKALEKDRERRYASASDLAADVRRHLRSEPIAARPASTFYQLRKFARRNRGLVTGLAATAVALVLGLAGTIWKAREATVERDHAREQTRLAQEARADAVRGEAAAREAREAALRGEAEARSARAAAVRGEAEARAAREEALRERAAARAAEQAALFEKATAEAVQELLLDILSSPGPARSGRDVTVLEQLSRGADALETGFDGPPTVRAAARLAIASAFYGLGLLPEAEPLASAAHATFERELGPDHEHTLEALFLAAATRHSLGDRDGEALLAECEARFRRVFGDDDVRTARVEASVASVELDRGRLDVARLKLERAEATLRARVGDDAEELVPVLSGLGVTHHALGDLAHAEELLQRALALRRQHSGDRHPDVPEILNNLGFVSRDAGRMDEAEQRLREAVDAYRSAIGPEHPDFGTALQNLAGVVHIRGRSAEAVDLARRAVDVHRAALRDDHPSLGMSLNTLAVLLHAVGDGDAAAPIAREALAIRRARLGVHAAETLDTATGLARILADRGDEASLAEATELFADVLTGREASQPSSDPAVVAYVRFELGRCLATRGRADESEPHLRRACEELVRHLGAEAPRTRHVARHLVAFYEAVGRMDEAQEWRERGGLAEAGDG